MKPKRAITVRAVTMPTSAQCAICTRYGGDCPAAFSVTMPPADRRGAARVSYCLDAAGSHVRLAASSRDRQRYRCYVCGPCREAIRWLA